MAKAKSTKAPAASKLQAKTFNFTAKSTFTSKGTPLHRGDVIAKMTIEIPDIEKLQAWDGNPWDVETWAHRNDRNSEPLYCRDLQDYLKQWQDSFVEDIRNWLFSGAVSISVDSVEKK